MSSIPVWPSTSWPGTTTISSGGHVLKEDAGVTLLTDPIVMEIAERRAMITHGDAVGAGATRERIERRIARSRAFVGFVRARST